MSTVVKIKSVDNNSLPSQKVLNYVRIINLYKFMKCSMLNNIEIT